MDLQAVSPVRLFDIVFICVSLKYELYCVNNQCLEINITNGGISNQRNFVLAGKPCDLKTRIKSANFFSRGDKFQLKYNIMKV